MGKSCDNKVFVPFVVLTVENLANEIRLREKEGKKLKSPRGCRSDGEYQIQTW